MAIGGSILLILAGVTVASGPGAHPGRADVRYAGLALAAVGLVVLWLAIVLRYRPVWLRERRRATYARARSARRVVTSTAGRATRRYPRRPVPPTPTPVIAPAPEQPLESLGQVASLVDHTQIPGQHGKRPPSPRGRLRYPF
ncbi:MAG: hypothetical protein V7603_2296 [Micromonosporaceae bacterium]|jgi:hypothetical protein